MPYPMDKIIDNTLTGIAKAQKDYESWTGGYWLWQAPEYLITTYIARQITTYRGHNYYVTLEHNTRAAIDAAGGMRQGRPRRDLRLQGKFDILLWWANDTPRAIIEVKRHISAFEHVEKDVARICSTLKQENHIRAGLVAYYTSHGSEPDEVAQFISERLEVIETGTRDYVENKRGMKLRHCRGKIRIVEDSAWVPGVLKISRS